MKSKMTKKPKMTKVVIKKCYGGFGLSYEGMMEYAKIKGVNLYGYVSAKNQNGSTDFENYVPYSPTKDSWCIHYITKKINKKKISRVELNKHYFEKSIDRDDPSLVKVVEKLGEKANGIHAQLKVIEIPSDITWTISEYDGIERIDEDHRSWG